MLKFTINTPVQAQSAAATIKLSASPPTPLGRKTFYTVEQIDAALRCKGQMKKADAAIALGLTEQQVHYLWYVREAQRASTLHGQQSRRASRTPLEQIVPDPIREDHNASLPGNTYRGQRTKIREDVIKQVRATHGQGHSPAEVGQHFNLSLATVRYIWYQLPAHDTQA